MITLKLLQELDACDPGIEYFEHEHGEEATIEEVLGNPRLYPDYAAWLGQKLPAEYMTWEERVAVQCSEFRLAMLGRQCPAGVKGATWKVRLALQRNDFDRALLGRICPAGVMGATWKARLDVQRNEHERTLLGRTCPTGVDGATLKARLALQPFTQDRNYVLENFGCE